MDPFKLGRHLEELMQIMTNPKKGQLEANPNTKKTTSRGKKQHLIRRNVQDVFRYCNLISSIQNSLLTDYTLPWIQMKLAPPKKTLDIFLAIETCWQWNGWMEPNKLTHHHEATQKKPRGAFHCPLSWLDLPRSRHHNKKEKWCCPRCLGSVKQTNLQWIFQILVIGGNYITPKRR